MQRIGNLNWENITYDHDISGLVRGLTDWGVIEGGTIVGNKLQPVQAIVPLVRSNGQKILAFFESDEMIDLPTTGDYKVYIEVDQSKIDFGGNNAEDGTGIASIKTWPSVPSQNFLLLASVTSWVAKDERNLIPKVGQIAQRTTSLEEKVATQEQKVGKLESGSNDHLAKKWIIGERYGLNDSLILQESAKKEDCTVPIIFGTAPENGNVELQMIANGENLTYFDVILDRVWVFSTAVQASIYLAEEVEVSATEVYRKRKTLLTDCSVWTVSDQKREIRITPNSIVKQPLGTKMVLVLSPYGNSTSQTNYFRIYCDSTQISEAFSFVYKDSTKDEWRREKVMPYLASDGILKKLFTKVKESYDLYEDRSHVSVNPGNFTRNPVALNSEFHLGQKIRMKYKQKSNSGRNNVRVFWGWTGWVMGYNDGIGALKHWERDTKFMILTNQTNPSLSSVNNFMMDVIPNWQYDMNITERSFYVIWIFIKTIPHSHGVKYVPKEIKQIWEMVVMPYFGFIEDRVVAIPHQIPMNKTIAGNVTTKLTTPSDWFIEAKCNMNFWSYGEKIIIDNKVVLEKTLNNWWLGLNMNLLFPVRKWEIIIQIVGWASMEILSFICL